MLFVSIMLVSAAVTSVQGPRVNGGAQKIVEMVPAKSMIGEMVDYEYDVYRDSANGLEYVAPPKLDYIDPIELDYPVLREQGIATDEINPASREITVFFDLGNPVKAVSAANGTYSLTVPAASYILWADADPTSPNDENFVIEYDIQYFKNDDSRVGATPVEVEAGAVVTDIDFELVQSAGSGSLDERSNDSMYEWYTAIRENTASRGFRGAGSGMITGTVTDKETGLALKGVNVYARCVSCVPVFLVGDPMVVTYEIEPATKTVILEGGTATAEVQVLPDAVDAYIAFRNEAGQLFFVGRYTTVTKEYFRKITAFVQNAPITQFFGIVGAYFPDSKVPPGNYEIRCILVPPATNPADRSNWISNLVITKFSIGILSQ